MLEPYDAVLLVSFGGPEGPDEVMPFLENVVRGRRVPRERLLEVAEHYYHFGGVSPINAQNRALLASLVTELNAHQIRLPVYWGNRNWNPLLTDSLRRMAQDGIRRSLAFVTSAYSSYSSCRQYLEDIERAREELGSRAPIVEKLRVFYNHPGFLEPIIERTKEALADIPKARSKTTQLIFTAHSIPRAMSETCRYEEQLRDASLLISSGVGHRDWNLVFQSRSGSPMQPWLEPDVCDYLENLASAGEMTDVVIVPVGFVSDHLEVLYDLDVEARQVCDRVGLNMIRVPTVGNHPRFVQMIRELIEERLCDEPTRLALGDCGPCPDVCPPNCCRTIP